MSIRFAIRLNALALYVVAAVLLAAFYFQLALGELPCPLCLLQRAGFAALVVEGRAERPLYLEVFEGGARLRDASRLWGLTTVETQAALRAGLVDPAAQAGLFISAIRGAAYQWLIDPTVDVDAIYDEIAATMTRNLQRSPT